MESCQTGCELYQQGGALFCHCACLALNSENAFDTCRTGCGFGREFSDDAPGGSTAISSTILNTPRPSPTQQTTNTITLTTIGGDSSSPAAAFSTSSASTCQDDNTHATRYFAGVLGRELSCADLSKLNACTNAKFSLVVTEFCPKSCGICGGPDDAKNQTTSSVVLQTQTTAPQLTNASDPIDSRRGSLLVLYYAVLPACLFLLCVIAAVVVVAGRMRRARRAAHTGVHHGGALIRNDFHNMECTVPVACPAPTSASLIAAQQQFIFGEENVRCDLHALRLRSSGGDSTA